MPLEDCLACARDFWNVCGYEYNLLRKIFSNGDRSGIHVTDLTGCLLRAYNTKVAPAAEYPHERLMLTLGSSVHAYMEDDHDGIEYEIDLKADGIAGRADVYYGDGTLVDYKTTRWLTPSKLPYGSHALQLNIYAHLLRQMGKPVNRLFVQYIDMSGPTKCKNCKVILRPREDGVLACPVCSQHYAGAHTGAVLMEIPISEPEEIASLVAERRDILKTALETATPPPGEPSFLCGYCSFRLTCPDAN